MQPRYRLKKYALLATVLLTMSLAFAEAETATSTAPATTAVSADDQQRIKNSLAVLLPTVVPDSIQATPMPGFFEVVFGPRLVYITSDGRYLFQGNLIDLETRENLTEPRLTVAKAKAVEAVGEKNMLIFEPEEVKHTITVFTDIDCGYCRKLHAQMDDYLANGIRIRYLFFPRAGKGSESYVKAISVWCADDPKLAMTEAKKGKPVPVKSCDNPVQTHLSLGTQMGVQGTPALVLDDGEMIPGYMPPDRLKKVLDLRAVATAQK